MRQFASMSLTNEIHFYSMKLIENLFLFFSASSRQSSIGISRLIYFSIHTSSKVVYWNRTCETNSSEDVVCFLSFDACCLLSNISLSTSFIFKVYAQYERAPLAFRNSRQKLNIMPKQKRSGDLLCGMNRLSRWISCIRRYVIYQLINDSESFREWLRDIFTIYHANESQSKY